MYKCKQVIKIIQTGRINNTNMKCVGYCYIKIDALFDYEYTLLMRSIMRTHKQLVDS